MKIIGITGGIGSGKSRVLYELSENYGAYIIEADTLAHSLMLPGMDIHREIIKYFGEDILNEDGTIDRVKLGQTVFNDTDRLKTLNSIVHPMVKEHIRAEIREKKKDLSCRLFVIEAALLIQDGYRKICDELWYVYASRDLRIKRLMEGRGYTYERCIEVMESQPDDAYFIANCDIVIDNSGDVSQLLQEIAENITYTAK